MKPLTLVPSYFEWPSALTTNRQENIVCRFSLENIDQGKSIDTTYSFYRVIQGLPVMEGNSDSTSFPKVIVFSFGLVA